MQLTVKATEIKYADRIIGEVGNTFGEDRFVVAKERKRDGAVAITYTTDYRSTATKIMVVNDFTRLHISR